MHCQSKGGESDTSTHYHPLAVRASEKKTTPWLHAHSKHVCLELPLHTWCNSLVWLLCIQDPQSISEQGVFACGWDSRQPLAVTAGSEFAHLGKYTSWHPLRGTLVESTKIRKLCMSKSKWAVYCLPSLLEDNLNRMLG